MKPGPLITTAMLACLLAVPALAQPAPAAPPSTQDAFPPNPSFSGDAASGEAASNRAADTDDQDDDMDNSSAAAPRASAQPERGQARRTPAERVRRQFGRMDRNKDGAVDEAEMERVRLRGFNRYDTNDDGQLDSSELNAAAALRKAKMQEEAETSGKTVADRKLNRDPLRRVDANSDGVLTKDEFLASPRRMMQRADTDKDGKVSLTEMEAGLSRRASQ